MLRNRKRPASSQIDMTTGPILSLVVSFALPLCIGSILQQLYGTVDTLIIGNFCSSKSLAAVGTAVFPLEIFSFLFMGIGTGASILVSQYVGTGDNDRLKRLTHTSITFLYIFAIPASIIGVLTGAPILRLMQVPEDVLPYALSYLQIVALGQLGSLGYNMNAGLLRGLGDSKSSLLFLVVSCILNIFLDILFIAIFHMDVAGAALATSIAMFVSWIMSILYIRKHYPDLEFSYFPQRSDKEMFGNILKLGIPLGINNSFFSAGHIVLQTLVNAQGATFMAACSVGDKLSGIANVAISAFASAASTFAGQNLGARKMDRLKKGTRQISILAGGVCFILCMTVSVFCRPLLQLFTHDPAIIDMAMTYIWVFLPPFWTYAVLSVIISISNGIGDVKYSLIMNILMLWAVRVPAAFLVDALGGGPYIIASYPISYVFGMIAMIFFFKTRSWKRLFQN